MKKHSLSFILLGFLLTGCLNFPSPDPSGKVSENPSPSEISSLPSPSENRNSEDVLPSSGRDTSLKDPYINRSETQFYENYTPAVSYRDSVYRTKHYFLSGDLEPISGSPVLSSYQPKIGDTYIRNLSSLYSDNGNTYTVLDSSGQFKKKIYKGAAYITIDDVCAYVMAFGEIPANYDANKKNTDASKSPWGKYLRVNFSRFYNDTEKYPNEPKLPSSYSSSSNTGDYLYYEMDIGGPGYNNGTRITRNTCRVVFSYSHKNNQHIEEAKDRYVFFTNDHYESYVEYLNYFGGFGENFDFRKQYVPTVSQEL